MQNGRLKKVNGITAENDSLRGSCLISDNRKYSYYAKCEICKTNFEHPVRSVGFPAKSFRIGFMKNDMTHKCEYSNNANSCQSDHPKSIRWVEREKVESKEYSNGSNRHSYITEYSSH